MRIVCRVSLVMLAGCAQLFGIDKTSAPPPVDASIDAPAGCGDGIIIDNEPCNGSNLGSSTCATAVEPGWVGTLTCSATCTLDTTACAPPQTTYGTLTDTTAWSVFDVSTLFAGAKGFVSSVFDGRYLYLVPNSNTTTSADGLIARYDTQGSLGASSSWTTFDVSTVNANATGFQGGAFDGRYVYLVPYNNNAGRDGLTVRLDTQAAGGFSSASSWSTFDISTVNASATGFIHAAFDGRYVYYAPFNNGAYDGMGARFDTQAVGGFTAPASWEAFDISTVNAAGKGYLDVVFDGRYVYYVPYYDNTAYDGVVPRFDPQAPGGYGSAASWTAFNMQTVDTNAVGMRGGAFDGRYLYFAQYYDGALATPAYGGYVMQYDTRATGGFGSAASWKSFDSSTLTGAPRGYTSAVFDGRYVYFVTYYNGTAYSGEVSRYDTTASDFTNAASWSTFDAASLNAGAIGFDGIGFDGQNVYLVPNYDGAPDGVIARFAAKTPSWLPLLWNNSFD